MRKKRKKRKKNSGKDLRDWWLAKGPRNKVSGGSGRIK